MFRRKKNTVHEFDRERFTPVVITSICTGEMRLCFRDRNTGDMKEVGLIRDEKALIDLLNEYSIDIGEVKREY